VDTWEEARFLKKTGQRATQAANGCCSSTCHGYHGTDEAFQKISQRTQGRGANRVDIGFGEQQVRRNHALIGSKRYIDWVLVDWQSIHGSHREILPKIRIKHSEVHTMPGTKLPGNQSGYGSDHYPISILFDLLIVDL